MGSFCSCDLLLRPAPATCSCDLLLRPAPATCFCFLLLVPATCSCRPRPPLDSHSVQRIDFCQRYGHWFRCIPRGCTAELQRQRDLDPVFVLIPRTTTGERSLQG